MKIITQRIAKDEFNQIAAGMFGNLVKAVCAPSQGNKSRGVDNPEIRKKIMEIVAMKVER